MVYEHLNELKVALISDIFQEVEATFCWLCSFRMCFRLIESMPSWFIEKDGLPQLDGTRGQVHCPNLLMCYSSSEVKCKCQGDGVVDNFLIITTFERHENASKKMRGMCRMGAGKRTVSVC